ncbi:MAG: SAM-dependent methyltransferase, partial [Bacteroidetes bacterium HGW-Bacteroidetes-18]
ANSIKNDGYVYIGELHPFKQYSGTKARFETEEGLQIVHCFNHHISDFTNAAKNYGFAILSINEYFDDGDKKTIPRILTLLLKKLN